MEGYLVANTGESLFRPMIGQHCVAQNKNYNTRKEYKQDTDLCCSEYSFLSNTGQWHIEKQIESPNKSPNKEKSRSHVYKCHSMPPIMSCVTFVAFVR
jgi:hypothetical protein